MDKNIFWISGPQVLIKKELQRVVLKVEQGRITKIQEAIDDEAPVQNWPEDAVVLPGFIDMHIHGAGGCDVMDGTPDALKSISQALVKEGVTGFLATTMTQSNEVIESALSNIKAHVQSQDSSNGAQILGVHLEGPFIAPEKMGAQNAAFIQKPCIKQFQKWQKIAGDHIRLVTLAPEREGAGELIAHLVKHDVVASVGHTNAPYADAKKAFDQGAHYATHLFNAMSGVSHREPGVAAAVLEDDRVMAELIVDGVHVDPCMCHLTHKIKGAENLVLVTDAMRAKCMPEGKYDLGGQMVIVSNTAARLSNGVLAGSILTMNQACQNMMKFTDCGWAEVAKMTSENPANMLGLADDRGRVAIGHRADLVVMDQKQKILGTLCAGKIVFQAS